MPRPLDEMLESLESEIQSGSSGWTLPTGQNCIIKTPGGHLSVVHTSLLEEWAETLRAHLAKK